MRTYGLGNLPTDGVHRVQRRHRLLEDDGNILATDLAQLVIGGAEQFGTIELDAARHSGTGRQQRRNSHGGRRFPRAGFTDDGEHLALGDGQRDTLDRRHPLFVNLEIDSEVLDLNHGICGHRLPPPRIESVTEGVTNHDEAEHGGREEEGGNDDQPRGGGETGLSIVDLQPPRNLGQL